MAATELLFARSLDTDGVAGFPTRVRDVGEARRIIEQQRLPMIRSRYQWVDAYNRLTLAQATGVSAHVEAARIALSLAVASEQRSARTVPLTVAA